jgi:hypothetical protein
MPRGAVFFKRLDAVNVGSVALRCQGEEIGRVGLERKSLARSYTANE